MQKSILIAALVLATLAVARPASAALLTYDGFDYTSGALLSAQTNPMTSTPWASMGPETDDGTITTGADNLTVSGLAASTGNAYGYGGIGKTNRLSWGAAVSTGSAYYSVAFKITDLTNTPTTGAFILGFNNSTGTSGTQPGTILSRMVIKQIDSTHYQIGLDRSTGSAGQFQFDGVNRNLGDTQFVVAAWDIVAGANNDVARMWINPSSSDFGAALDPTPNFTIAGTGTQTDASIASFLFKQSATSSVIVPAGVVGDEVRVGTTWADVTPPIPEPAMVSALALLSVSLLQRRRA